MAIKSEPVRIRPDTRQLLDALKSHLAEKIGDRLPTYREKPTDDATIQVAVELTLWAVLTRDSSIPQPVKFIDFDMDRGDGTTVRWLLPSPLTATLLSSGRIVSDWVDDAD